MEAKKIDLFNTEGEDKVKAATSLTTNHKKMNIKTTRNDLEIWEIDDSRLPEIMQHLRLNVGEDWKTQPKEIINDSLRNFLYYITEPSEEIPGEGEMPTTLTGANGFFEDLDEFSELGESVVNFFGDEGQPFEFTAPTGEIYSGLLYRGGEDDGGAWWGWIDWDTTPTPSKLEKIETLIFKQYQTQQIKRKQRPTQ